MSTRVDIRGRLEEYARRFCLELGYSGTFAVEGPYYPYDNLAASLSFPCSGHPGCYVFADGAGDIKYVGKGSRFMGNRIGAHIGRLDPVGSDPYPECEPWMKGCRDIGVWAIAVPDAHWWLAPALEGYITEHQWPDRPRRS